MRKKKNTTTTNQISVPKKPKSHESQALQVTRFNEETQLIIWPRSSAMERAQEISANLSPGFLKSVQRSNVTGRFCVYLPKQFCDVHLLNHDHTLVLVDEDEREYSVKYVLLRNKLDGGWRVFSNEKKLIEGDVLVFHLVGHCRFKVYVIRGSEDHGDGGPLRSDSNAQPIYNDQSGNRKDVGVPHVLKRRRFSKCLVDFEDMKCYEDFQIRVGGLILDSDIPEHLREKYYELCCGQDKFLHDNLIKGLNTTLAVGIISETTNISAAIRAANLSTPLQQLENWDKTLEAVEDLGMLVNFLRVRLQKLVKLACESNKIADFKAKRKESVMEAKVLMEKGLEAEVEDLEVKNLKLGFEFKKVARAPW